MQGGFKPGQHGVSFFEAAEVFFEPWNSSCETDMISVRQGIADGFCPPGLEATTEGMMNKKAPSNLQVPNTEAEQQLERIVQEQGIKALTIEVLVAMGDVWPEDESVDEFLAFREEQRRLASRRDLL